MVYNIFSKSSLNILYSLDFQINLSYFKDISIFLIFFFYWEIK